MTQATATRNEPSKTEARKSSQRQRFFPWRHCIVAAVPVGILAFYVTRVAPDLLPLPPNFDAPFPVLTQALEDACIWCGENQLHVYAMAAGLLLLVPGLLFRVSAKRYFVFLTLLAILTLGITYYSVSAPVERLMRSVKDNIPQDDRTQLYLKK